MDIDNKEVFRYAGFHGNRPDEMTQELVEKLKDEIKATVTPKHIIREVGFTKTDSTITIDGGMEFTSKKLVSHLKNSEKIILFAATLGVEADALTRKYQFESSANAVLTQAALAAAIESYCDEICEKLACEYEPKGLYLRPRFSPGYADMALSQQKIFFSSLEITKRIGVTLNDEYMMIPTKSVTAFIGVTKDKDCNINNCVNCNNTACEFRRE